MRRTISSSSHTRGPSPLFTLPAELLPGILNLLAPADLAALSRTARCLREPCARDLYAHIRLCSYDALCGLVCTLETRPRLGVLVRRFVEEQPFVLVEPRPETLARALRRTPRLRALALASPIDVVSPDLAMALRALGELATLHLGDATPETLAILAHVRPVRALSLRRSSVGWSSSTGCDETALAPYLLRGRDVLRALEIDGGLLEPVLRAHPHARWPAVHALAIHGDADATMLQCAFPQVPARGCRWDCAACSPKATSATLCLGEPDRLLSHWQGRAGLCIWISLCALLGTLFLS